MLVAAMEVSSRWIFMAAVAAAAASIPVTRSAPITFARNTIDGLDGSGGDVNS